MDEALNELTLLDYWNIAWKYRKFISAVTGIVTVLAVIYSLNQPKIYTATVVVLPPELEDMSKGGSMTNRNIFTSLGDVFGGGFNYSNIVIAMLKSNRMAEGIIEKFELQKIYKTASISGAINTLRGSTNISVTKEKAIAISVDSKDPKLAAVIANFYVANLDIMNQELELTSAKPVVRLLDKAVPPERRSKPSRSKIVLVAFALSLFGCYSGCVIKENYTAKRK